MFVCVCLCLFVFVCVCLWYTCLWFVVCGVCTVLLRMHPEVSYIKAGKLLRPLVVDGFRVPLPSAQTIQDEVLQHPSLRPFTQVRASLLVLFIHSCSICFSRMY